MSDQSTSGLWKIFNVKILIPPFGQKCLDKNGQKSLKLDAFLQSLTAKFKPAKFNSFLYCTARWNQLYPVEYCLLYDIVKNGDIYNGDKICSAEGMLVGFFFNLFDNLAPSKGWSDLLLSTGVQHLLPIIISKFQPTWWNYLEGWHKTKIFQF